MTELDSSPALLLSLRRSVHSSVTDTPCDCPSGTRDTGRGIFLFQLHAVEMHDKTGTENLLRNRHTFSTARIYHEDRYCRLPHCQRRCLRSCQPTSRSFYSPQCLRERIGCADSRKCNLPSSLGCMRVESHVTHTLLLIISLHTDWLL